MVNFTLLVFWWSVNWIVMESSLCLEISISHYSIFKWYVPPSKLTGVRVQAEATSAVACLNSVWYSAIFSFVWISSHDVQNHKPANTQTKTSSRKCTWGFQSILLPTLTWHSPYRLILHDADRRRRAEDRRVVVFVCHEHSGGDWTPASLRDIHCLVCGSHHEVKGGCGLTV